MVNNNYKLPKNIRQVGQVTEHKSIYIEDYVMTYTKQLVETNTDVEKVAILLGNFDKVEEKKIIFIRGAMEADMVCLDTMYPFSNEIWASIYEVIKQYFPSMEVVGWFLTKNDSKLNDKILNIHKNSFSGQNKVFILYNVLEKEEICFLYENNLLKQQQGYYIFYDRNEEMQTYMIENKKVEREEEIVNDRATREVRSLIERKKEESQTKQVVPLFYAASSLLAVVVLVIGATMLNNYDQMKNLEQSINFISENLTKNKTTEDSASALKDNEKDNIEVFQELDETTEKITKVETMSGNLLEKEINFTANSEEELDSTTEPKTEEKSDSTTNSKTETKPDSTIEPKTEAKSDSTTESKTEAKSDSTTNSKTETKPDSTTEPKTEVKSDSTTNSKTETKPDSTTEPKTEAKSDSTTESKTEAKSDSIANSKTKADSMAKSETKAKPDSTTKPEIKTEEVQAVMRLEGIGDSYIVESGDTLASISEKLYRSIKAVEKIKQANNIEDENKIFEGQILIIPK